MEKGKIIFLNGVSSSGKTTLAKVLQERLNEPFYEFGPDTLILTSPQRYFSKNPDTGVVFEKMVHMLPHMVKMFSDYGVDMIINHVLGKNGILDYLLPLHNYPVLFVHVTCPLDELRRREKERGDRGVGNAESQLKTLYPQDVNLYDISIDTFVETSVQCADKIIELMGQPNKHKAFNMLWKQRDELGLGHANGFDRTAYL